MAAGQYRADAATQPSRAARPAAQPLRGGRGDADNRELTHELANLLDASMRCLSVARRSVPRTPGRPSGPDAGLDRKLETVQAALEQMASLVRSAMHADGGRRNPPASHRATLTLAAAATHAAEIFRPLAEDLGIRVETNIEPASARSVADGLFTVLADALRNAIESIERAEPETNCAGGRITISSRIDRSANGNSLIVEVTDDGIGPPNLPPRECGRVFEPGFSTKPEGTGIGLATARAIIHRLGGDIRLLPRSVEGRAPKQDGFRPSPHRPGAVLRITLPIPTQTSVGGPNDEHT